MFREGRELIPTAKAFQLMTLLRGLGVEELSKPELTGEWEYKLAQMEHGKLSRDEFMGQIADLVPSEVASRNSPKSVLGTASGARIGGAEEFQEGGYCGIAVRNPGAGRRRCRRARAPPR